EQINGINLESFQRGCSNLFDVSWQPVPSLVDLLHRDKFDVRHDSVRGARAEFAPLDVRRTAGFRQNFVHGERLLFSLCLVVDEFSAGTALVTGDRRFAARRYFNSSVT